MVAEGQVASVEVEEDEGEHEEDEDCCACESKDEAEDWTVGEVLFYVIEFHTSFGCGIQSRRETETLILRRQPSVKLQPVLEE